MSPEEDPLPEGWVRATLGTAFQVNPPKPPMNFLSAEAPVTFVPMPAVDARSGTIATPTVRPYADVRKGFTAFRDGDVILAKITPCMENGKAAIAERLENGIGFGSTEFHVLRPTGAALAEYGYFFIRQECFRRAAESQMTGSVGQRRVPAEFIKNAPIPLAPLAEQRRIVEKVEVLLARVDAARARLAALPGILKRFRQAVLAAACSGRLTADWRESNPADSISDVGTLLNGESPPWPEELPESWLPTLGGAHYVDARYGTSVACDRADPAMVPVIRIPNIVTGRLDLADLKYAPLSATELRTLLVRAGDILVCRTNGSLSLIGKAAIAPRLTRSTAFASYLIRLRVNPTTVIPEYFHNCLTGPIGRAHIAERARTTAGQFNLNLQILRDLPLPLPPLAEQREIVRRVQWLFALADQLEQRVALATARADRMTQAILSRAFLGELVPQDPADEPASLMLERLQMEKRVRKVGIENETSQVCELSR